MSKIRVSLPMDAALQFLLKLDPSLPMIISHQIERWKLGNSFCANPHSMCRIFKLILHNEVRFCPETIQQYEEIGKDL